MRLTLACDCALGRRPGLRYCAKAYRAARDSEAAHALYSWLYQISKMAAAQDEGLDASTICGAEARKERGRCCHPAPGSYRESLRMAVGEGARPHPGVLPPARGVRRLLLRLGQVRRHGVVEKHRAC